MSIKEKQTLMKRRKLAIIAAVLAIAILIPTFMVVDYFIRIFPYYDIDGTKYLLKPKNGVYCLYDTDGNLLPTDSQYGYFVTAAGTLVNIDSEAGTVNEVFLPDTEGTEVTHDRYPSRLLIFEHLQKDDIRSIEVVNSEDSYVFQRLNKAENKLDDASEFSIKGAPFAPIDPERFSVLYTNAGYTITKEKIVDPIKDANGEFSEYGLVPETRTDAEGTEYSYVPAYYIITAKNGDVHKIIVGDLLPDGSGYYVQYVAMDGESEQKRDAVYVLDTSFGKSMLASCEYYVTPTLVYPLTLSTHTDVQNFTLTARDETQGDGQRDIVGFSSIDYADREGTIAQTFPYVFTLDTLKGYNPDADNVGDVLFNLYQTDFAGVELVAPTDEDLVKYGLAIEVTGEDGKTGVKYSAPYNITYDCNIAKEGEKENIIRHLILISEKNEDGNYYAFSFVYEYAEGKTKFLYSYDAIVEVSGYCFDFLNWNSAKWINNRFMSYSIAYCKEMSFEFGGNTYDFVLDNSLSTEKGQSDKLIVNAVATNFDGEINTFSAMTVIDQYSNRWEITTTSIKAYTPAGVEATIQGAYFAENALGKSAKVLSSPIVASDGSRVSVSADSITVTTLDGKETSYVRYGTDLFRRLYESIAHTTIENSYTMTDEQEKELIENKDKLLMSVRIKDNTGNENVYKFYTLTGRKAYITINGNGGYYLLSSRIEKLMNDVPKFFRFEVIEPTDKT